MEGGKLIQDQAEWVGGATVVGQDQQVIFRYHLVRHGHLVQQKLQAGLEAGPVEFELNGVSRLQFQANQGRSIQHHGNPELFCEHNRDLFQRGSLREWHIKRA